MAMPMPAYIDSSEDECDSPKFTKGQEVWCLFDKIYYKAKVLSVGLEIDGEQYYPIHYFKFSKKYDEPVKESRLLPIKLKSNKYIRKFNKNTVAERKKKRLEKKLKDEIMEIAYSGLPVTKQRPFLNLKRLSMEMVSTTPKIQTVSNDGKELVSHAERNVVSECQPLEGRKEYEQTNEIDSIVDKSQQISTLELQLNNFPSTSEQDLEQVAIKTLDNMLSNTLKRQNVNKLVKDQSQLAVHECEEVTTSNKEDELLSKNSACLIDANDDTINKRDNIGKKRKRIKDTYTQAVKESKSDHHRKNKKKNYTYYDKLWCPRKTVSSEQHLEELKKDQQTSSNVEDTFVDCNEEKDDWEKFFDSLLSDVRPFNVDQTSKFKKKMLKAIKKIKRSAANSTQRRTLTFKQG